MGSPLGLDTVWYPVLSQVLLPAGEGTILGEVLHAHTVWDQASLAAQFLKPLAGELGETPVLRGEDLLSTRELELGPAESLDGRSLVAVLGADGHDGLTDANASHGALWLAKGSSHSRLEPISSGTRQHLVDAHDVEGMQAYPDVEGILAAVLDHVLVGADAACLQGLRGELLELVGHQVDAEGEVIHAGLLAAQVEDAQLGVWDTAAKP